MFLSRQDGGWPGFGQEGIFGPVGFGKQDPWLAVFLVQISKENPLAAASFTRGLLRLS